MIMKTLTLRENREEGFTLLEISVVVLITGILTAIALPALLHMNRSRNDTAVTTDVLAVSSKASKAINGPSLAGPFHSPADVGYTLSEGVEITMLANHSGVCVKGWHKDAIDHSSPETALVAFNGRLDVPCDI